MISPQWFPPPSDVIVIGSYRTFLQHLTAITGAIKRLPAELTPPDNRSLTAPHSTDWRGNFARRLCYSSLVKLLAIKKINIICDGTFAPIFRFVPRSCIVSNLLLELHLWNWKHSSHFSFAYLEAARSVASPSYTTPWNEFEAVGGGWGEFSFRKFFTPHFPSLNLISNSNHFFRLPISLLFPLFYGRNERWRRAREFLASAHKRPI